MDFVTFGLVSLVNYYYFQSLDFTNIGILEIWFIICSMILCVGLYFVPFIISVVRKHNNKLAIFIINIFFGWTLIGWVGSLVWAVIKQEKKG